MPTQFLPMHRHVTVSLLTALFVSACTEAPGEPACATTGAGSLTVNVAGLPAGLDASVTVQGPGGMFVITATTTLPGLASGSYDVTALPRATDDPYVSPLYGGASAPGTVCVTDAATRTAQVTYAPIPSAGIVWVGAGTSSLGFTSAQLAATATLAPAVNANTKGSAGATFDRDGNLWVRGLSPSDPDLMRYPASALAATGTPTPDRRIDVAGLPCEGSSTLAFDENGALWMSMSCMGAVVRLRADQLTRSGSVSPTVAITELQRPDGIAFGGTGDLWIADDDQLRRYDRARLGASTGTAADLVVTLTRPRLDAPSPIDTLLDINHLAFDASGDLWGGSYGSNAIYRIDLTTIPTTGVRSHRPDPIIYLGSFSTPRGFAFDNSGGLLVAYNSTTFARFSPAQLTVTSSPPRPVTPERIFASSSILGYAENVVLFPAPAGTPLYHRVR